MLSALSLPEHLSGVEVAVQAQWETLQAVDTEAELAIFKKVPAVSAALEGFDDADVLASILKLKGGGAEVEPPVKLVELEALLAQPEGYEDDVPINPDFHAPPAAGHGVASRAVD